MLHGLLTFNYTVLFNFCSVAKRLHQSLNIAKLSFILFKFPFRQELRSTHVSDINDATLK